MLAYLYVAAGSATGGLARWLVGSWMQRRLDDWAPRSGALPLPVGTLFVNVSGSFLLGVILVWVARQGQAGAAMQLLLAVGFCGGYTTFSTFSADTIALVEGGAVTLAALNVAASLALSFLATLAGLLLGRALLGSMPA